MNVLVISPHPDDESIGCGGAIALHTARGDRVSVVFLTSGEKGIKNLTPEAIWTIREREAELAAEVLGIHRVEFLRGKDYYLGDALEASAAGLRPLLRREAPHRIYVPHPQEWHPDHKASLPILELAMAPLDLGKPTILGYEVWTPLAEYDDGENITEVMPKKLDAVRCYESQVSQLRYDRGVQGLNQYRGAIAWACEYAEVFRHLFLQQPAGEEDRR